jgi:hypothetical protein
VVLPYHGDNSPGTRADRDYVVERIRAAGIPTFSPVFPRDANGGLDVQEFMVSKIDRHPNRRYNLLLTSQLQPFLESAAKLKN